MFFPLVVTEVDEIFNVVMGSYVLYILKKKKKGGERTSKNVLNKWHALCDKKSFFKITLGMVLRNVLFSPVIYYLILIFQFFLN